MPIVFIIDKEFRNQILEVERLNQKQDSDDAFTSAVEKHADTNPRRSRTRRKFEVEWFQQIDFICFS